MEDLNVSLVDAPVVALHSGVVLPKMTKMCYKSLLTRRMKLYSRRHTR